MVKAYYMDEVVEDPRESNEQAPPSPARFETLNLLNCYYKFYDPKEHFTHYVEAENAHINNENEADDEKKDNKTMFEKEFVYPLLAEMQYKHYDLITVSEKALGAKFDAISTSQLREHIHEDDEVRVIISGEGYFDIRDPISGNLEHHAHGGRHEGHDAAVRYAYLSQLYRQVTDSAACRQNPNHFEQHKEEILTKYEHLLDAPHQRQLEGADTDGNNNNDNNKAKSKQPPPLPAGPHEQRKGNHHHHHSHSSHDSKVQQQPFQFRNRWIRIAVTAGDCLVVPKGIYHRFTTTTAKHITALRLFKDNPKWVSLSSPEGDSAHNHDRREYLKSILFRNVFCYETAVGEIAAPYYYHQHDNKEEEEAHPVPIFNKNVYSFQTYYPEEVNGPLQRILSRFISQLKQTQSKSEDKSTTPQHVILFYFTASKKPMTGQPWCPDCVQAHPIVKEAYQKLIHGGDGNNNNNNNNNNVLYCEFPVERPAYKQTPSYYYRTHPFFQLNNVPTVFVLTVKPSVLENWSAGHDLPPRHQPADSQNELAWTEWVDVKVKTIDPTVEQLLSAQR